MAKLLPRSAHLIRYGITDRPSVSLPVCLSIHSSSTSNFLIAAKTSNAARPTSFWPARQDLPLNLDASQVFYNLQCYICIHKVHTHTHTHMSMCIFILYTCRALLWGTGWPVRHFVLQIYEQHLGHVLCWQLPKAKAKVQRNLSLQIRGLYLSSSPLLFPEQNEVWQFFGVSISRGNYASFKRFSMGFRGKWKAKQGKQSTNWVYVEHVLWNRILFYLYTVLL